jgi:hypothetical protein
MYLIADSSEVAEGAPAHQLKWTEMQRSRAGRRLTLGRFDGLEHTPARPHSGWNRQRHKSRAPAQSEAPQQRLRWD